MQHVSVQKDSDVLKQRILELENIITRMGDEYSELEKRLNMSKDHARVLVSLLFLSFFTAIIFSHI